jgi:nucleoside-diphosphate-sugar epimerase
VRVLITGAAGMIGRKLAARLASDRAVGTEPIDQLVLADVVGPVLDAPPGLVIETVSADVSQPGVADILIRSRPDVVFHLAAVVSGEAEADFEKGYRVNVDGMRHLLEAIRSLGPGYRPRFVFASSIAVFGAPFPDVIPDDFCAAPLTSYGTQKAIGELLLCDYSRRGFLDGVGVRLPTITVRPGAPNKAASGFFSGIIREPLDGRDAVLPVPDDIRHWHASPRAAVEFLLHAATLDAARLGQRRCLTMPGVSVTVAEQIEALRRAAGDDAVSLVRREPDEMVMAIVGGWPREFDPQRALSLGFRAESTFDEIVRVYIEDELEGQAAS